MILRDWLYKQRLSVTFFAALMKVDRSSVHRWLRGKGCPSEKIMNKIREISMNQVDKYEDLIDVERKK